MFEEDIRQLGLELVWLLKVSQYVAVHVTVQFPLCRILSLIEPYIGSSHVNSSCSECSCYYSLNKLLINTPHSYVASFCGFISAEDHFGYILMLHGAVVIIILFEDHYFLLN